MRCEAYAQAVKDGLLVYDTGKPCKRGHNVGRYTSTRTCVECAKKNDPKYQREWYIKNKQDHLERSRQWYRENKERKALTSTRWCKKNPDRVKEIQREYRERHPEKAAEQRRCLRDATPQWANKRKIRRVYKTAQWLKETTGLNFHVDHIIPLKGKVVCGLHVENNLQIIPAHQNRKKSNNFEAAKT